MSLFKLIFPSKFKIQAHFYELLNICNSFSLITYVKRFPNYHKPDNEPWTIVVST